MGKEAISISDPSLKALYRGDGSEGRWDIWGEDCKSDGRDVPTKRDYHDAPN
jgi:hypothetical protein